MIKRNVFDFLINDGFRHKAWRIGHLGGFLLVCVALYLTLRFGYGLSEGATAFAFILLVIPIKLIWNALVNYLAHWINPKLVNWD